MQNVNRKTLRPSKRPTRLNGCAAASPLLDLCCRVSTDRRLSSAKTAPALPKRRDHDQEQEQERADQQG